MFTLDDFDYACPPELIAQHPLPDRGGARMLVMDRTAGAFTHASVARLPDYLQPGDTVVVNATRVFKARLRATRTNGREAEVLLVRPTEDPRRWTAMVHPGGKLKTGRTVSFGDTIATVTDVLGGGLREIAVEDANAWPDIIRRFGKLPLPPYIDRPPTKDDDARYQTIFAQHEGSVAAPTAGLHFTPQLVTALEAMDVALVEIVLHVGPGTFKPVQYRDLDQHDMHEEWYQVSEDAAHIINTRRAAGGRTWAVGTTVTRVLETMGGAPGVTAGSGWTRLFVKPPYTFSSVDGLLTNFHLPRSTLLMLVSAFGGYELTMRAYREAVEQQYRLYSYGDAMLIT